MSIKFEDVVTFAEARETMANSIKEDAGIRIAYLANIAMLLSDKYGIEDYYQRNEAAKDIINLIFADYYNGDNIC